MDKIIGDFIPLICGGIYLLLMKGVLKLPLERQMRFDAYVAKRKNFLLIASYALIFLGIGMMIKHLFFPSHTHS
jgi:hypothetical protein